MSKKNVETPVEVNTPEVAETPEATTETPAQPPVEQLTVSDLSAMKVIIDIASSRGAFKPNEMVVVGQTYNKLVGFLDNIAKTQSAANA